MTELEALTQRVAEIEEALENMAAILGQMAPGGGATDSPEDDPVSRCFSQHVRRADKRRNE